MQEQAGSLEELFGQLLPENQNELRHYLEFLIAKQEARARRPPQFDWAGAAADLREQHSSVELQHEIANWRAETE